MARKVWLIYQDCPMCGARKEWGLKQTYLAGSHNIEIVPKPFYATGSKDLIMRAIQSGIGKMPFFTDGDKFAYDLVSFIETPADEVEEAPKKTAKKRKAKDGSKKTTD